jgi:hypothetical protein
VLLRLEPWRDFVFTPNVVLEDYINVQEEKHLYFNDFYKHNVPFLSDFVRLISTLSLI